MTSPPAQTVDFQTILPLRHRVLRPDQPMETAFFEGDHHPKTGHVAVIEGGAVLAVGSVMPHPMPGIDEPDQWQLRGMATDSGHRKRGLGGRVVRGAIAYACQHKGRSIWCNARAVALNFYVNLGFEQVGEPFEIEGIGTHYRLRRGLI